MSDSNRYHDIKFYGCGAVTNKWFRNQSISAWSWIKYGNMVANLAITSASPIKANLLTLSSKTLYKGISFSRTFLLFSLRFY